MAIEIAKDNRGHWVVTIEGRKFHMPPRFDDHSEMELINLPCQVVQSIKGHMLKTTYENILLALDVCDLNGFCGPMADKHNGEYCLRFESTEAYARLSA